MKKKEPITLNIFEKYKAYKKLNANEYKKEKQWMIVKVINL